jgi:protoporphyrinogen oxidase
MATLKSYQRRSSVFFSRRDLFAPNPLQNNLRFLGRRLAEKAIGEMENAGGPAVTMKDWLERNFGPTLCEFFFFPFHERYTAGLYERIAPQDTYKSPVDLALARRGLSRDAGPMGYNATFFYPDGGMDGLASRMAGATGLRLGCRVARIDPQDRVLRLADGTRLKYKTLISTLPLNVLLGLSDLSDGAVAPPYTSVAVLNIGGRRGPKCPDDHWLYVPDARSGFHRVGIYSNVSDSFLPRSARAARDRVALYVERAYPMGERPSKAELSRYCGSAVRELQSWGWLGAAEVIHPTWIEVAYTWQWPGSDWRRAALARLKANGILSIGRYGSWQFQGIAESIEEGLRAGKAVKKP